MKLFFIHLPKTSGTAMKGRNLILDVSPNEAHKFNVEGVYRLSAKERGFYLYHTNYYPIHRYPKEPHLKVTIVRNPFDLLWSYYRHGSDEFRDDGKYCRSGWASVRYTYQIKTFKQFIKMYCDDSQEWHVPALKDYLFSQLFDDTGKCVADIVIKFEFREEALAKLEEKYNVGFQKIKTNVSRDRTHYKDVYDAEMIDLVYKKCRKELDDFGYDFNGSIRHEPLIYNPSVRHIVMRR